MGSAVAHNILRGGFDLVVHDRRPEAATSLLEQGATWSENPAALITEADIVVSMVFGPVEIEEVVRGTNGLLEGDCKNRCWIDMTTSKPDLMRELAQEFAERGGLAVDAPVTGSVDAAIRGDMIMFVGGTDQSVERAQPVLSVVGVSRRVGQYGNGYVAKLVNNQLWKIHAAAIGEAMVAAKLGGLEPDIWWRVMKGGAADSFVMRHDVPSIFAGHYDPSFPLSLVMKDLDLISGFLNETNIDSELTQAAHRRFQKAYDAYGPSAGEMTVCKLLEDQAGVDLRVEGNWIAPWEAKPIAKQ
jgi:3-hydroxyisobutyrate dehydrogenase-like beta-hydroxyacid dehydrogenase